MGLTLLNLNEARPQESIQASAKTLTLTQPEQWQDMFVGMKSATGKVVGPKEALRASCVLACIRILMEDIAALPLILKRNTPDGPEEATDHPLYRLLKIAPNAFQTSVEVREHIMLDMLLFGHFACWAERNGAGKLIAIHPLQAESLSWTGVAGNGDLVWQYSSQFLSRQFTQQELWRGQIMSRSAVEGRSLILLAREAIGLAIAAEEQGARLFSHGIQSDMVITSEETVDDKEALKESILKAYSGSRNAWMPLLLEGGLKAERIGLTAQESQYLEARNYQLADVARIFRIPSVMLGIVNDKANTYSSTEQFFLSYEKHAVRPWSNRIEQTVSRDLILPSESDLFAKHDLTDLLRADMKTRYEAYSLGIGAGFLQLNEPRVWEGLPKDPKLNVFLRSIQTVEVGQPNPTAAAPPAAPTAPHGEPKTKPDPAKKLSAIAASAVVNKERKWFDRQASGAVTDEQLADFQSWHVNLVVQTTGASDEKARIYCQWRAENKALDDQAAEKIFNLCMEVSL